MSNEIIKPKKDILLTDSTGKPVETKITPENVVAISFGRGYDAGFKAAINLLTSAFEQLQENR